MRTHAYAHTYSTRINRCARMRMRIRIVVHTVDAADASNVKYIQIYTMDGIVLLFVPYTHTHGHTMYTAYVYYNTNAHMHTYTHGYDGVYRHTHVQCTRALVNCTTYIVRGTIYEIR